MTNLTRIFVLLFGAVAYLIAVFGGQSLVALLLGAYGSIVQFLPLVAATFFWPRATKAGAICGLLAGVIYNYGIVLKIIPPFGDIHAGIQGLIVNFVVLIVLSLITKPMDKDHVYRFIV